MKDRTKQAGHSAPCRRKTIIIQKGGMHNTINFESQINSWNRERESLTNQLHDSLRRENDSLRRETDLIGTILKLEAKLVAYAAQLPINKV